MPLRRRPARLPVDRRARARRRAVARGPARRRRHPRRPRHLLLPRATRVAVVLPVHARPQHAGAGRQGPVRLRRPVHVDPARAHQGARRDTAEHGLAGGPPSTTATRAAASPPCTAGRCELDRERRELRVFDEVFAPATHPCRLAFHLGPEVTVDARRHTARLSWYATARPHGRARAAAGPDWPHTAARRPAAGLVLGRFRPARAGHHPRRRRHRGRPPRGAVTTLLRFHR